MTVSTATRTPGYETAERDDLRRLATYATWPLDQPPTVSLVRLSAAGYKYSGRDDCIICVYCNGVVSGWARGAGRNGLPSHRCPNSPNAGPSRTTRNHSQSPPRNHLTADQTSEPNETKSEPGRSSQMSDRIGNSTHSNDRITPTTGSDVTPSAGERSPLTSIRSRDISTVTVTVDRENPDREQLKDERFRLSTFQDWTRLDIDPVQLAEAGFYYTGRGDRVKCVFCNGVLHHWESSDRPDVEHRRHFPSCPLVRGLNVGNIAIQQHTSSVSGLVAAAPTEHVTAGQKSADDVTHTMSTAAAAAAAAPSQLMPAGREDQQRSVGGDDDEEIQLVAENRRLHDAKTCKVCMDAEVDTVFLPCGHLVSCHDCSPRLRNCPVCRTLIRGTVKTFFS